VERHTEQLRWGEKDITRAGKNLRLESGTSARDQTGSKPARRGNKIDVGGPCGGGNKTKFSGGDKSAEDLQEVGRRSRCVLLEFLEPPRKRSPIKRCGLSMPGVLKSMRLGGTRSRNRMNSDVVGHTLYGFHKTPEGKTRSHVKLPEKKGITHRRYIMGVELGGFNHWLCV